MHATEWRDEQARLRKTFSGADLERETTREPTVEPVPVIVMKTAPSSYDADKSGIWTPPPGHPGGPPK